MAAKINADAIPALVRNTLIADTAVSNLVSDRIRTAHARDPDSTLVYPLVILDTSTGVGSYEGRIQRNLLHIYAYSDQSQARALTLYNAVFKALQGVRLYDANDVIKAAGYGRETERPVYGYNDQIQAWYARGAWVFMAAGGT